MAAKKELEVLGNPMLDFGDFKVIETDPYKSVIIIDKNGVHVEPIYLIKQADGTYVFKRIGG